MTAEGAVLVAAVADDLGRTQDAIPFTCAFPSLHVDPVLVQAPRLDPIILGCHTHTNIEVCMGTLSRQRRQRTDQKETPS